MKTVFVFFTMFIKLDWEFTLNGINLLSS